MSCPFHLKQWCSPVACLLILVLISFPFDFPLPECGFKGHQGSFQGEDYASSVSTKCFLKHRETQILSFLNLHIHFSIPLPFAALLSCLASHLTILGTSLAHGHLFPSVPSTGLSISSPVEEPTLVWRTSVYLLPQEHTALGCLEEPHLMILSNFVLGFSYRSL